MPSNLEAQFALYWRAIQGPPLVPEFRFHPTRRWKFDFASPSARVGIELEGIFYNPNQGKSRHQTGTGYKADCEKYNAATLDHWAVFRMTSVDSRELERIAAFVRLREKIFADSPSK